VSKLVFAPATKAALKARVAFDGVSGGGKTLTSLIMARGLVGPDGSIGLIDTERRKASLYSDRYKFSTLALDTFAPELLVEALAAAVDFDCCIVDSLSHFWVGIDGMLEQVDRATARSQSKNAYTTGWKEMSPVEKRMIDALLAYPGHLIVTMRTKSDYIIEAKADGKSAPKKIGMKPIQREGLEYEFDLVGSLDDANTLTVTKSRYSGLNGAVIKKPTEQIGVDFAAWLNDGAVRRGPRDLRDDALKKHATADELLALYREAKADGILGAAVVNEHGETVTIEELIQGKGKEARAREAKAKAADAAPATPAGTPADEPLPGGEVKMSNGGQQENIGNAWVMLGITDRSHQLARIAEIIGRTVTGEQELTYTEALAVFDWQTRQSWAAVDQQAEPETSKPLMVSPKQHARMGVLWKAIGYDKDRERRLNATSHLVGRRITTSNELTADEADTVIDGLEAKQRKDRADARAKAAQDREPVGASA